MVISSRSAFHLSGKTGEKFPINGIVLKEHGSSVMKQRDDRYFHAGGRCSKLYLLATLWVVFGIGIGMVQLQTCYQVIN